MEKRNGATGAGRMGGGCTVALGSLRWVSVAGWLMAASLGCVTVGLAGDGSGSQQGTSPERGSETTKSLLQFYAAGGVWMHPILLCSLGAVATAVLCALQTARSRIMPGTQVAALEAAARAGSWDEAWAACEQRSPLATVMGSALLGGRGKMEAGAALEGAASEALAREESRLMVWVNGLNVAAQIAPMLGLLGTVVGMIQSFDALAAGKAEPQELADGIGVAMLTTAFGLIVAIPSMAGYFYFRSVVQLTVDEVQRRASGWISELQGLDRARLGGGGDAEPGDSWAEPDPCGAPAESEAASVLV